MSSNIDTTITIHSKQKEGNTKLTILLITYNRLTLLKEAISSCVEQSVKNFDLIVIDNNSTDGTCEYLREYSHLIPQAKIIQNPRNLGPRESILIGLDAVKTSWVTILCDDDILCKNFVDLFYQKNKIFPGTTCIAFSTMLIDDHGKIIKTEINKNKLLSPNRLIQSINELDNILTTAGISNFCFWYDKNSYPDNYIIKDYPNGYFTDTFLFIVTSLKGGVLSCSEVTYKKRVWEGQESSFSNERLLNLFAAFLKYENDLRMIFSDLSINRKLSYVKLKSSWWFFKSFLFQIVTLGSLTPKLCISYLETAYACNKRYLPHAFLMVLILPFVLEPTIGLRKWINQLRKKFVN